MRVYVIRLGVYVIKKTYTPGTSPAELAPSGPTDTDERTTRTAPMEEVNTSFEALFLIASRSNCISQLHIAKPVGTTLWRKPLLTKLRGCDGAFGGHGWPV